MAEKKKRNPKFTSPAVEFKYPKLTKVDYGTEKYPKKDGEYSVTARVKKGSEEHDWFVEKFGDMHKEAVANGRAEFKKLPAKEQKRLKELQVNDLLSEEYDKETDKPTGYLLAKIKMKASGVSKKDKTPWTRKPALFDAKGKPLKSGVQIWGGTIGKVAFEASPYFIEGSGQAGVSFYLDAAQVIELKSGNRDASDYGFGSEDGYDGADDEDNPGVDSDAPPFAPGKPDETGDDGDF